MEARTLSNPDERGFVMNHGMLALFVVPAICIAVIAFTQFGDELFKKKFFIERRIRTAKSNNPAHNRRHSDANEPTQAHESQPSASSASRVLETSGNSN
jgi:hypothetical protein